MSGYTCDCDEEEIFDQLTAVIIIIIINYAVVSASVVKSLHVLLMVLIVCIARNYSTYSIFMADR